MKKTIIATILFIICLCFLFGCGNESIAETPEMITSLSIIVTAENISQLESYISIQDLDLSGSTCYAEILGYCLTHPEVNVKYNVDIGGSFVDNASSTLSLKIEDYDFETLLSNLVYLPNIERVTFDIADFSKHEYDLLCSTYDDIDFSYVNAKIIDEVYPAACEKLDLSHLESEDVFETCSDLQMFDDLTYVELMNSDGSSNLTLEDVKKLIHTAPNADFHYTFELFGKTVSTIDESAEFIDTEIGNEGEQRLRDALDVMTSCKYFKLDNCGIDDDILAKLRDDYPDTKIVWRIFAGEKSSFLTDTETVRIVYGLDDTNSDALRYCNEAKYMDIGHNTELYDFDFIEGMISLEIVIASGSPIKSASVFSNCPKLEFLELAWCGLLTDISELYKCTNLKHLNLCYSKVTDIGSLDNLPLEQFSYLKPKITKEQQNDFVAKHPDCAVKFEGKGEYGTVWRYKEDGGYTDIYRKVRDVFGYDDMVLTPETMLPKNLRE